MNDYQDFLEQRNISDSDNARNEYCEILEIQASAWGEK
jgi:hypothetical protein